MNENNNQISSKEFELLKEKFQRNEQILIQAYKSIKEKEKQLKQFNEELQAAEEELRQSNEYLYKQKEELITTLDTLKNTQSQLVQSEKMASIGILTAGVAHEINNPLNFIQGGKTAIESYIKEMPPENSSELLPLTDIIQTGIDKAAEIVQSLNHFSRQRENNTENCNIHFIIDNCLVMLHNQAKNKVEIIKQYTESEFSTKGNEGKLHQVFLNVLTNALQASNKNDTISIITKAKNNNLTIHISDTGCGIRSEDIKKIFDPFFTTKEPGKGTGLGLSIAYNAIKEHNGNITYASEFKKGTTVTIIIPIKK